jgi:DNA-directed RNA polymerase I, II, and III subunit RPABC1
MSITAEDVTRLFRVRRTVQQMLLHRGYVVLKEDVEMTLDQFKARFGDQDPKLRDKIEMIVAKKDDPAKKLMVFFGNAARLGIEDVRHYVTRMETESAQSGIVVAESVPTPRFKEQVNVINAGGQYHLQMFEDKELLVNITEHVLVPLHMPLTKDEIRELLHKYKLKLTQLPRIQLDDPIARYYGLSKGDVVKIIRQSETAGRYVTYRTVV